MQQDSEGSRSPEDSLQEMRDTRMLSTESCNDVITLIGEFLIEMLALVLFKGCIK